MNNTAQFIEMLNEQSFLPDSDSFNDLSSGKKMRSIRKSKNISVLDVADTCRLSKSAILHYENDIRKPSAAVLTSIADQLNVPPSTLVEYNLHSLNNCIHALFEIEESGAFNSQTFREALIMVDLALS